MSLLHWWSVEARMPLTLVVFQWKENMPCLLRVSGGGILITSRVLGGKMHPYIADQWEKECPFTLVSNVGRDEHL